MKQEKVILLSGTLCDESMWQEVIDVLDPIAEVHIADMTKHNTIKQLAESIIQNISGKLTLIGFSLGGIVALEIMKLAPERIEKLVLISTNPHTPTEIQKKSWDETIERVKQGDFLEVVKSNLLPVLISEGNRSETIEAKIIDMARKIGSSAYINQLEAVYTREDLNKVLDVIQAKTLLIVGKEDVVCPPEFSEYMNDKILDSKLKIISKAGHMITLEKGIEVAEEIKTWVLN